MTDTRLQVFCTVAEQLSFSKAAKILGISQPAVTKHISRLEQEIGSALFVRISNTVLLTEIGEAFYKKSYEILKLYQSIDSLKYLKTDVTV
ncbi:MAG: LysR family transcriptional regulator [Bacteroidales bacterium]|mgnify:CR=1 FL=1|nr:LysR family transcriptional regulator [Bacteroidales bacterium]MDD4669736.1 LysR family transcriptional regulator [Bacteroidales bacterium]